MNPVNIDQLLRDKAPGAYKFLPGFVIKYIKKILHEKDINDFLEKSGEVKGIEFVNASLEKVGANVIINGKENIPPAGGYIFASNHPLGGLDGLALIASIGKVRTDIKFFVNENLMAIKNLEDIFVPVNIYGQSSRQMLQKIEEIYSSNAAIPIFPAGLVSRRSRIANSEYQIASIEVKGTAIRDLPWKKSFITHSKRYRKDIIPVWVEGANSNFFYNFAKWRKRLGIKFNVEMFFLVDEMFKQKNKNIILNFGRPISYKTFSDSQNDSQWAAAFQDKLYEKKAAIINQFLIPN